MQHQLPIIAGFLVGYGEAFCKLNTLSDWLKENPGQAAATLMYFYGNYL